MTKKPSYEELERRVEELERQLGTTGVNADLRKSTELFEKTFRSQADAVFILGGGISPRIIDCNPAAEKTFGYSHDEMLNRPTEFLHVSQGALQDFQKQLYPKILEKGFFHLDDFMMKRKDGESFPTEHTVWPLNDESGERTGWVSVVRDVTRRKKAEEKSKKSEDRYRLVTERTSDLISITTFSSKPYYVYVNPSHKAILGYKSEDLIGKCPFDFIHPQDSERLIPLLNSYFAAKANGTLTKDDKGPVERIRYRLRDSWGNWRYLETTGDLLDDEHVLFISRDITEREKLEKSLRESEERYRILVENANDAIFITQGDKIEFANPKAREMGRKLGFDWDGKPFYDYIHPEDRAIVTDRQMRRMQGEDLPPVCSFRLINDRGEERWVELNTSVVNWEGKPSSLNFLRDIAAQKALEAELQHARRMEALGTLAGGVAHDFNNLLMGIQGRISMMLMNTDASHAHYRDLMDIEEIIRSGAGLTRQLLGLSRGGKYEVRAANLNSLIQQTLKLFGRTKKHIEIQKGYQRNLWAAEVDRGQIEQVLLNLFLNASEAMPNGGTLSIHTRNTLLDEEFARPYRVPAGRFVHISIADTGVGMDEETLRRIFEPFFTTKEMGRGTGLGLASAYGIIKTHGGIIKASSRLGSGSTFDIYLPASERAVIAEPTSSSEPVLEGTETLLLVDDEPKVLDICQRFLSALGYSVLTAKDGWEALQIYERNKASIDIVILDMVMPGMSGPMLFDRLRAIEPSLRAVVSTGYSVEGEVSDLTRRGCNGCIQKPFSMRVLANEIRRVLDEK